MRTVEAIDADLRALGRPMHPGVASITRPALVAEWRRDVAVWRGANPGGEERYALLLEELEAVEFARVANNKRAARARDLAGRAGLPKLVRDALGTLERLPVLGHVEAWLSSGKAWLVLAGGVGTGKSVSAGYALTKAAEADTVAWVTAAGFATAVGGFSGQGECERLKHVGVLVLDDVGTEHMSPFAASVLFEVLHHRHEDGRRTILTTNLDRASLRARLGERLADRVASDCHYVEVTGASLRGQR
jgi:DNA replication protein DnaC